MSNEVLPLYSQKILALTMAIPHTSPISGISAKRRSPICGSEIEVSIALEGGRIANFSQNVRACALGQASAAIFGANVIGRNADEIKRLQAELTAFLKDAAAPPQSPFAEYEILRPAQGYKARHASILLVIEATMAALDAAEKATTP